VPDLTEHTAEILSYVAGGLAMTFLVFRFATFLEAVAISVVGSVRDFLNR
jgi:hypothetical protein